MLSAPCSPSNLSSVTLVASSPSDSNNAQETGGTASPAHRSPTHAKEAAIVKDASQKEATPGLKEAMPKGEAQRKTSAVKYEGPVDKRLERCISEDSEGNSNLLSEVVGFYSI